MSPAQEKYAKDQIDCINRLHKKMDEQLKVFKRLLYAQCMTVILLVGVLIYDS